MCECILVHAIKCMSCEIHAGGSQDLMIILCDEMLMYYKSLIPYGSIPWLTKDVRYAD